MTRKSSPIPRPPEAAAARRPLLDFTPVPRKCPRHDGWTPERQKAFIACLADTGCVAIAARMVNMSPEGAYTLRRAPGAEGFRRAWEAAQTFGLQVVKDEAFDRAMNGQLVPVFVGGRLMGFRRKKNDRLLMFILRHYGQDAQGRKTTVNYFSSRATAGAAAPSGRQPTRSGAPTSARDAGPGRPTAGEAASIDVADSLRDDGYALAAAEASTTTVKTVITGADAPTGIAADDEAAAILNAFEGVALDGEAQAEIYRTLEACAERRRALEADPADDPHRIFIGPDEAGRYLGELESGSEFERIDPRGWQRPEGEHHWESLGEGGNAAEIDRVVAEMAERRAKLTPEEIAAEKAESVAAIKADIARQQNRLPPPARPAPDPESLPRTGSGDPRLDWRNWTDGGDKEPSSKPVRPKRPPSDKPAPAEAGTGPISPRTGRPMRRYKKRQPKPAFILPDEARKAETVAEVGATRRANANAQAERRKAKARRLT